MTRYQSAIDNSANLYLLTQIDGALSVRGQSNGHIDPDRYWQATVVDPDGNVQFCDTSSLGDGLRNLDIISFGEDRFCIAGTTNQTLTVGSDTIGMPDEDTGFVACYDSNCNPLFGIEAGEFVGKAKAEHDRIMVFFTGQDGNGYVRSYDQQGQEQWEIMNLRSPSGLALGSGNTWFTISFVRPGEDLGDGPNSFTVDHTYVASYEGTTLSWWESWPRVAGSSDVIDYREGEVQIASNIGTPIDLGDGTHTPPTCTPPDTNFQCAILFARFSSEGTLNWSKMVSIGGANQGKILRAGSASIGHDGGVYITGDYRGEINFAGTLIASPASVDLFILRFSVDGDPEWILHPSMTYTGVGAHDVFASQIDPDAFVFTYRNNVSLPGRGFVLRLSNQAAAMGNVSFPLE